MVRSATPNEETGVLHARAVARASSREIACDLDLLQRATRQLAEALNYLHHAGKLHCDIKPSNVLVRTDGVLKLLDFGLTSEFGLRVASESQVAGTPAYMSPEQGLNQPLSEASDWYSVGVMLFEALTGQRPFSGTYPDVLRDKAARDGPAPSELVDDLPPPLDDLCQELLTRRPELRPGGAEVIARLNRLWPQGRPVAPSVAGLPVNVFVGRDHELKSLADARAAVRGGRAVLTYVHGSSGIGKTALVNHFVERLRAREPDVAVLAGRCYERESVSYKALDSVVDELSQYLRRLGRDAEAAGAARCRGARAAVSRSPARRVDRARPRSEHGDRRFAGAPKARIRGLPRVVLTACRDATGGRVHRRFALGRHRQRLALERFVPAAGRRRRYSSSLRIDRKRPPPARR